MKLNYRLLGNVENNDLVSNKLLKLLKIKNLI